MAANKKNPETVQPKIAGGDGAAARARRTTGAARRAHRRPGLHSALSAAVVVGLHASVLYVLAHAVEPVAPAVSVPLMISLATANEPVQVKPKIAPPPKPRPKPKPRKIAPVAKVPDPAPVPVVKEPKPEPEPPVEEPPPPQAVAPPPDPAPAAPAPPQVIPPRFDAAYLNNPVPAYPALARRLGEQGRVLLRVFVRPDGSAGAVEVRDSSGSARLDRAAKEAVERWKFTPARRGSQPIGAWVVVPVKFSLSTRG